MAEKPARTIRIKRGLDLPVAGAPQQEVHAAPRVRSVALLGQDYRGIRPELMVAEGHRVRAGQPLFRDRKRPDLVFTAPGQGVVEAIHRGARRALQAVTIKLDDNEPVESVAGGAVQPENIDRSAATDIADVGAVGSISNPAVFRYS